MLSRPVPGNGKVAIQGFVYGQGDLSSTGRRGRPARVRKGRGLTFVNRDAKRTIYHTITALQGALQPHDGDRLPACRRQGRLRLGRAGLRPARLHGGGEPRHVDDAEAPEDRQYTYFCRVHPFMRGAFEVKRKR